MDDPLWFEYSDSDLNCFELGSDLLDLIQITDSIPLNPLSYGTPAPSETWQEDQSYMFFGDRYEVQGTESQDIVALPIPTELDPYHAIPDFSGADSQIGNFEPIDQGLSPAPRKNKTASSILSKKRVFEDGLSEFLSKPDTKVKRRKRFTPEDRNKVAQLRKVGACIPCRLLKLKCKLDAPCTSCQKLFHGYILGQTLCIRQKLLDVRFTSDLWNRQFDMAWLKDMVGPLQGHKRATKISLATVTDLEASGKHHIGTIYTGGFSALWAPAAPLMIKMQPFVPNVDSEREYSLELLHHDLETGFFLEPEYFVIPPDSLPTLGTLETWALNTARSHRRAFVGGFRGSFLSFALRYYESKKELPMKDLMKKVVRLSYLHGLWGSALPKPRGSRQESRQYASKAIHKQIALVVSKEIIDLEIDVLSMLQKQIFSPRGPGKNMLPIWTSLWLLILMYRQTVHIGKTNVASELAQQMYNMLISIYSSLFKPSSPLWLNFLKDDVFHDIFGRDPDITERLGQIKTEMLFIHKDDKPYQHPTDELLRSLIFDHEKELGHKLMKEPSDYDGKVKKSWYSWRMTSEASTVQS